MAYHPARDEACTFWFFVLQHWTSLGLHSRIARNNQHVRTDQLIYYCRLVLETLTPLPSDRKCFRMINGVLVERTVGDVLPQLKSNSDNMNKVLEELAKQYKTKQDDMEKWKVCVNIPFAGILASASQCF